MRIVILVTSLLGLIAAPALAQTPPAQNPPAQNPEGTPMAVRGTVEKLDAQVLSVKTKDGAVLTVALAPNFTVVGVAKRSLGDIKPGDYIATNSIKGTDGKQHAIEMHIFPEAMRATVQDVQRPSSLVQGGLMTNSYVLEVSATPQGQVLKGKYKDGEIETIVEPDAPIVIYVPGDPSLLKPGAAVVIFAVKKPDGSLTAARVTAEKDGVKPPM